MLSVMSTVWSLVAAPIVVPTAVLPGTAPLTPTPRVVVDSAPAHPTKNDSTKVDTIYTCPMDPQVVKHEPGNCPVCGMKLVKKVVPHDTTTKADTTKKKSAAADAPHAAH